MEENRKDMSVNDVKNDLLSDKPGIGPFMGLKSADLADIMGKAAWNFIVTETEYDFHI